MARRNRNPHYWKVYHSSGVSDPYRIIRLIDEVVEVLGSPWSVSDRGRPPLISPGTHASICIFMLCVGVTLREMEWLTEPFFYRHVDHSTIGWAMQRIPTGFLTRALKVLYEKTDGLCGPGVFIPDSTGIETDRYKVVSRVMTETRERLHRKLHVIVKHYTDDGIISILGASETDGDSNDSPVFRRIFDPNYCHDGLLFADRGYDGEDNIRLCYDNKLVPHIKQRDFDAPPKGYRRKAAKDFDHELYRQHRGLVEGVFGGLETRYGNKTRYRLQHTRRVSILIMAIAHNIRALTRAQTLAEITHKDKQNTKNYFFIELLDNPEITKHRINRGP